MRTNSTSLEEKPFLSLEEGVFSIKRVSCIESMEKVLKVLEEKPFLAFENKFEIQRKVPRI